MQVKHGFPGFDEAVTSAAVQALHDICLSGAGLKTAAERDLAHFTGGTHACLTGSGFAALQAALVATGVRAGEPVMMPTVTCPSVYHAVRSLGAEPLVLDVSEELPLLAIDGWSSEREDVRFIIAPHMFGLVLDLAPLHARGLTVIEDCAQSQRPGRDPRAAASVYSFSPTKLQTMGYGGGVVTDDAAVDDIVRHFLSPDDDAQSADQLPFRVHAPVADFQCAMLSAQLARHDVAVARRRHWVERYDALLGHPDRLEPTLPFRYLLRLPAGQDARTLAEALRARGVTAWPLASQLLHQVFELPGEFARAERWQRELLSLPLHEGLSDDTVRYVCDQLKAVS